MPQPLRPSALGAPPAPGFEEPFAMLEACHERVERMLALLRKLREHLRRHGADDQARQAAADVMRYFDLAAPQHHRDEELHVFPPLLARGECIELVRRLQADHVAMEQDWTRARAVLQAIADGTLRAPDPAQEAALDAFAALYAQHLQAEEGVAYPAARRLLDDAALLRMAEEMMRRRGVR